MASKKQAKLTPEQRHAIACQKAAVALGNLKEQVAKFGNDLCFVINMSGGKDSVRMMGYLEENFPGVKKYAVMADTGFEHTKPVSAEDFARERCAAYGLELHVVKNPNKTYLQMVENRRMFPAKDTRQCTSDLKRGPVDKFIRSLPHKVVVSCIGIRAAESTGRGKKDPWVYNASISASFRAVYNWMPIFAETLDEVLGWHKATGTPLHPVYTYAGGYLKRLSCRVCIFSGVADIRAIYQHDREAFDLVSDLEQKIGFTMINGQSLIQIVNAQPTGQEDAYGDEEYPCAA